MLECIARVFEYSEGNEAVFKGRGASTTRHPNAFSTWAMVSSSASSQVDRIGTWPVTAQFQQTQALAPHGTPQSSPFSRSVSSAQLLGIDWAS